MYRLLSLSLCAAVLTACQIAEKPHLSYSSHPEWGLRVTDPFERMIAKVPKTERVAGTVYFEFNVSDLSDEAKQELDRIACVVSDQTGPVVVEGHTDYVNNEGFNTRLGYERALMVAHYLKSAGVWEERLFVRSFGEDRPAATNFTDNGRAFNRRAVVKIFPQGEGMTGKRALALDKKMEGTEVKGYDLNNSMLGQMLQPEPGNESDLSSGTE